MKEIPSETHERRTPEISADRILRERRGRAEKINDFCTRYYEATAQGKPEAVDLAGGMEDHFGLTEDEDLKEVFVFTLDAFRDNKPRKDGSPFASHSLELFQKAKSFGIDDRGVLATALLHDTVEDSGATLKDIEDLDKQIGIGVYPLVRTMTEKRSDGDRDVDLVRFVRQLINAEGLSEDEARAVVLVELLDRIDDLSNVDYLTDRFQIPGKKEAAMNAMVKKLAKCSFTVNRLTALIEDDELVGRLKKSFGDVYRAQESAFGVSEENVRNIRKNIYEKLDSETAES